MWPEQSYIMRVVRYIGARLGYLVHDIKCMVACLVGAFTRRTRRLGFHFPRIYLKLRPES